MDNPIFHRIPNVISNSFCHMCGCASMFNDFHKPHKEVLRGEIKNTAVYIM